MQVKHDHKKSGHLRKIPCFGYFGLLPVPWRDPLRCKFRGLAGTRPGEFYVPQIAPASVYPIFGMA